MLNVATTRFIGLMQVLVCVGAMLYVGWHGVSYNRLLREVVYRPTALCSSNPREYVMTDIKDVPRCVRRADAEIWDNDSSAIKVGIAVFLLGLFVPAVAMGRISFKGWNRG